MESTYSISRSLVPWSLGTGEMIGGEHGRLKVDGEEESGNIKPDEEDEDDDRPHFSLISGTYVHRRKFGSKPTTTAASIGSASEQALQISSHANGATRIR